MQQGIKKDPSLVIKLRATFLKVNFLCTYTCTFSVDLFLFACKKISRGSQVYFAWTYTFTYTFGISTALLIFHFPIQRF